MKWKVTEVGLDEVPTGRSGRYDEFIDDVKLRLEATSKQNALCYAIDEGAKKASYAAQALRKRLPAGWVNTRVVPNGGPAHLYVWRGPKYGKLTD